MKKLLSVLLALAIVLSFATVFAGEEVTPPSDAGQETESVSPTGETQSLPRVDLKKQIVPREEVPDLIDYEVAVAEKYVCRAYWEETSLNEVVFLKADGSLARYVFSFPVKYEADGEVYDKKPELEARETLLANKYRYQLSAQNDTVLYCAENLADGFYFEGEGLQVNLRPITETEYNFLRGHIDADDFVTPIAPGGGFASSFVTYDSVAVTATAQSGLTADSATVSAPVYALSTQGEQAAFVAVQDRLAVVPSYTGFQVQLELAENFAPSTVYFELDPNGLTLIREEDTLILVDRYGDAVGVVGDLLSSRGMSYDVAYDVIALDNGTYLLSATLPRTSGGIYTTSVVPMFDFLQDASIYSVDQTNYGLSANLWVGYYPGSGYERVLIRPNDWDLTEQKHPELMVQSAQIVLRDITATTPEAVIECRSFTGSEWVEIASRNTDETNYPIATWNRVNGNSMGAMFDSHAVSSSIGWTNGYYYSFNITGLVNKWYDGTASWEKGVIFNWQNGTATEMEKCFASTQYSVEAYRPQLLVEYASRSTVEDGVYYMESGVGGYLTVQGVSGASGNLMVAPGKSSAETIKYRQLWRVKHIQNGYYSIRPYFNTKYAVCNSYNNPIIDDAGYLDLMESEELESGFLWKIKQRPSGGFYLEAFGDWFCLINWEDSDGSRQLVVGDYYGNDGDVWNFEENSGTPEFVAVYDASGALIYSSRNPSQTPPVRYLLSGDLQNIETLEMQISICAAGTIDVHSLVWQSSNTAVVLFQGQNENLHGISEGTSLLSVVLDDGDPQGIPVVEVRVEVIEPGNYCIENVATGKFITAEQIVANIPIYQLDFNAEDSQIWNIQLHDGGPYYTITRYSPQGYVYRLGTQNFGYAEDNLVVIESNSGAVASSSLWDISLNIYSGNYVIRSKKAMDLGFNRALSSGVPSPNVPNGFDVRINTYSNSNIEGTDWELHPVEYKITVYHYFDQAFRNQYGENFYEDVNVLHLEMAEYFLRKYRLLLPSVCTSYISAGDRGEVTDRAGIRADLSEKYQIDKGIDNYDPVSEKCVLISWTGSIAGVGSALYENRTIVIPLSELGSLPFTGDSSLALDCLFHEFGHMFDLPDHYCRNKDPNPENLCGNEFCDVHGNVDDPPRDENGTRYVRDCEMSSWSLVYPDMCDRAEEEIYCSSCRSDIQSELNKYYGVN